MAIRAGVLQKATTSNGPEKRFQRLTEIQEEKALETGNN
jgi:hypothetical protein